MKTKTSAVVGIFTLVAQVAFAQDAQPFNRADLPALRTPAVLRAQAENRVPGTLNARTGSRDEAFGPSGGVACKRRAGKFPFKFDNTKVKDMVESISLLTCKNFIISSAVSSANTPITIMSRTHIDVDQAWQVFLSALDANNLSLVPVGIYNKIVMKTEAAKQNIPIFENGDAIPNNEGTITMLYDVQSMTQATALGLIKGFMKAQNDAIQLGDNYVLFSDSALNVRRIMKILEKADVPGAATGIHIYELKNSKASDIKAKLDEVFNTKSSDRSMNSPYRAGPPFGMPEKAESATQKIITDDRTNKLIIIASDKTYIRIREFIDLLDTKASDSTSQSQIYVYSLKNGDSKNLTTILKDLVSGSRTNPAVPRQPSFGPIMPEPASLFEGEIKINADEKTNSLVIVASPRDYDAVSRVIEKLDKERTQVFVEAVIMDVGISDVTTLDLGLYAGFPIPLPGVAAGGLGVFGNPVGLGMARTIIEKASPFIAQGQLPAAAAAAIPSFLGTFGVMGLGSIPLPGGGSIPIPAVGALLDVLQKSSNVDILATPSMMVLDNEKATIEVGDRIPTISFTSGVASANAAGSTTVPSITYQDAKLKFTITPSVGEGENVKLNIKHDNTEIGATLLLNGSQQPQFRTKLAETIVMAKDQQTVVMGGLINEKIVHSEEKIPLLGDLPILGHLFKKTYKEKRKSNLLLILTPHIIRSDLDLKKIHDRKMKDREEFTNLYFGDKITRYDPKIDYDKKVGPLAQMVREVETQMMRAENDGPGLPGEAVIGPEKDRQARRKDHKIELSVPLTTAPADNAPFENVYPQPSFPIQTNESFVPPPPPPPPAPEAPATSAPGTPAPGTAVPQEGVINPTDVGNLPPDNVTIPSNAVPPAAPSSY